MSEAGKQNQGTPSINPAGTSTSPNAPEPHWSLKEQIDHSKFGYLSCLPIKLDSSNYVTWVTQLESNLEMVELFEYCTGEVQKPDAADPTLRYWKHANAQVRSILTNNMTPEIVHQMINIKDAYDIWNEVRKLFAGQTVTDWTITVISLMNTKFVEGEDVSIHIAKMKDLRNNLILMNRNLDDDLFACFLRASMPPTWNYVFSGLPQRYMSAEIERRIRDESGMRTSQTTAPTAYSAKPLPATTRKGKSRVPVPGELFCTNCNISGHTMAGCWGKGGGAEGKGPRQKGQKEKESGSGKSKGKDQKRLKGKDRAHQAAENSDTESDKTQSTHSCYMTGPRPTSPGKIDAWVIDSVATLHICNNQNLFHTFTPDTGTIGGINDEGPQLDIFGRGDILISCQIVGRPDRTITLRNVAYSPHARDNLISEIRMNKLGLETRKKQGKVTILKENGEIAMQGGLRHGFFRLDCVTIPPGTSPPSDLAFQAHNLKIDINIWHRCFAHMNPESVRHLAKHELVTGLDLNNTSQLGPWCDGCAKGKHPQAPFPKQATNRAKKILDRIHVDLQGPMDTSILGYRYTLATVDDSSRKGWKEYMAKKSNTAKLLKDLIIRLETLTGQRVKIIRSDRGGEFIETLLGEFFKEKGITHELTAPYTSQQNGVAERFNRTTHEHALAMLFDADISKGFWPEAHEYASYVRNRSPTSALHRKTPNEAFYDQKPDVSTLRIFGSKCHVCIPLDQRTKMAPHSIQGVFCGFAQNSKAYKIWIPSKHRFMVSRDVIVYESITNDMYDELPIPNASSEGVSQTVQSKNAQSNAEPASKPETENAAAPVIAPLPPSLPQTEPVAPLPIPAAPPALRRSERTTRPSWVKSANNRQAAIDAAQ